MIDSIDEAIALRLQDDLPLVKEPYLHMAKELGITEEEVICRIENLKKRKVLRRIGAVLHHQKAGIKANAMVVWEVPEDQIQEAARLMASYDEISHCYQRQTLPKWPYNLYTMIHAKSREACEALIKEIAERTSIYRYEVLFSTKELKKISMKYFVGSR